jgi:hypothetical protein
MRAKRQKADESGEPEAKTVGVHMTTGDLRVLRAYRDQQGKETMVTPKEGPAALALFRAGARALGFTVPT